MPLCREGTFNDQFPALSCLTLPKDPGWRGRSFGCCGLHVFPGPAGPGAAAWWLPALEWEEGRQVSLTTLPLSFSSLGKCWPRLCDHSADGREGPWDRKARTPSASSCWLGDPYPAQVLPPSWKAGTVVGLGTPLPDPHVSSLFPEAPEGLQSSSHRANKDAHVSAWTCHLQVGYKPRAAHDSCLACLNCLFLAEEPRLRKTKLYH